MGTQHFDEHAATWDDDPDKVQHAQEVARAMLLVVPASGTTRLLEYGAGTGLVSQALREHVGPVTLADNSTGMREALGRKIAAGDLPSDSRVWDLDLDHQQAPEERFDLVVSSMVLHHVHDLDRVLTGLAAMVEDGGHLCVADLDTEDGSFHSHTHSFDGPAGFDRAALVAALARVGLTEVTVTDCTQIVRDDAAYPVFLAVGRRPSAAG